MYCIYVVVHAYELRKDPAQTISYKSVYGHPDLDVFPDMVGTHRHDGQRGSM